MDEINEHTDNMRAVNDALAEPIGMAAEFDEEELDAELNELEALELDQALLQVRVREELRSRDQTNTHSHRVARCPFSCTFIDGVADGWMHDVRGTCVQPVAPAMPAMPAMPSVPLPSVPAGAPVAPLAARPGKTAEELELEALEAEMALS